MPPGVGVLNVSFSGGVEDESPLDLGTVTHVCVCGCNLWRVLVTFEDYEISTYMLDMYCSACGAKALAPTEVDRP
jgi:hypothetical protein